MKNLLLTTILLTLGVSAYSQQFVKNTIRHKPKAAVTTDTNGSAQADSDGDGVPDYTTETGLAADSSLVDADESKKLKLGEEIAKVTSVNIYGGGGLLGLATGEEKLEDATGVQGSLGLNFATEFISTSLFFSYNGTQTVEMKSLSELGVSLSNPNADGQSISLEVSSKLLRRYDFFGLRTRASVINNLWQTDSLEIRATPVSFRFGLYLKPFTFDIKDNDLDIVFTTYFAHRNVLGDFGNQGQLQIGGTNITQRGYNGVDVAMNIFFNNIELFVQYSYNAKLKNQPVIPGFTGSQFTFGVNLSAAFLSLGEKKED